MADLQEKTGDAPPSPRLAVQDVEHTDFEKSLPDVVKAAGGLRTVDAGLTADQVVTAVDKERETRILRKVDWHIVPLLSFLYLIGYVDRSNIGNAKIAGMSEDLNLVNMRYNTALTLFFVPYGLFEVPSNVVLKLVRPSLWISVLLFAWGLVMTLMGIVKSYQGLYVARFFLGFAEAGFFPAATFLLTIWYKRYEVQRRMAVFYAAASLAGAFSGLLAFAIQHMAGKAGLNGWNWIFILEGLVPIVMSFVIWKVLPDNPETASFLTNEEKEFIINRLALETGSGHGRVTNSERIRLYHVLDAFKDWKIWCGIVVFWAFTIGTYGFTATAPTIVEQLGYTSSKAQLMTVPVYVFALLLTIAFAWASDYYQQRTPFIMAGLGLSIVGLIAELAIPHPRLTGVSYFFLYWIAAGLFAPFMCLVCLVGNNLAPSSKRAVGLAILISVGNLGGICGSNIFIAGQAPRYPAGYGTCLGICVAATVATYVLRVAYARENKRRDAVMASMSEEELRAQFTDQELLDLGDRSVYFRYTL
ncbi:Major Facilitator Superfamily protein [Niveomyces insectorum RCEF 264]|uniref:Major Facilitator Superfamily protein n=1 Tax=Niveomyces insectorum RCEF 264 TaxID=1081102 RepID=A0A168AH91_9HYPO|nr:Major Facilitator Superfamily protein [Niveomyces insectorum RCEF 264]